MNEQREFARFLSVTSVATVLGISRTTALALIQRHEIPAIRVGGQIRIPEAGFAQYLRDAGLDVELIYRGSLTPTTARAAPAALQAQNAERDRATGVTLR